MGDGATLWLTANLSPREVIHHTAETTGTAIWGGEARDPMPLWSVFWRIGDR
jgi:hypothetical protein